MEIQKPQISTIDCIILTEETEVNKVNNLLKVIELRGKKKQKSTS